VRQLVLVGLDDSICSHNTRLLWVTIEREAMRDNICAGGHSTKTKGREDLVKVIGFEDVTNLSDGLEVLITLAHEMKGVSRFGITI